MINLLIIEKDICFAVKLMNYLNNYNKNIRVCNIIEDLSTVFKILNNRNDIDIILLKLVPTLKLAFMSLIVMLIIAVPFGILAAVKKNKVIDFLISGTTFLGLSIPNFWVGLMLLYFIALKFKLLPVVSTGDGIEKMILPVFHMYFQIPICQVLK